MVDPAPHPGRWLMWGVPALLFLIGFFHRVAPGVIAKDLMQAFQGGGTLVGLLSATYFYGYAGLMLPAGVLIDAYGARLVVATGSAVMGLGTLAMAVAPTEPLLFAGRLVVGVGATVTFIGTLKIGAAWFPPSMFGTIAALSATMGVVGSLVATAPLAALVDLLGWRGAFGVVGLGTLTGAVVCYLVVRDRPAGAGVTSEPAPSLRLVLAGALAVLRNRHTWPPFVAFFFFYAATGNLMLWTVPYLRDIYGLSMTQAAAYAMATSLALLVSAPLTGWLSDRVFRRRKTPYMALSATSVALWLVLVATLGDLPLPGVFALFFAMGLAGSSFVLTWPIGREVNAPHLGGVAVAVVNLGGFLGAAITQWPLGSVLDARWAGVLAAGARVYPLEAYGAAFAVCAGFMGLSATLSLFLKETRGRNVWHELAARTAGARR